MTATGLREQKKTQTRELIADTAADLFARSGYEQVTVEDVATAAQVSKKTVFNYFSTKEDLVFARAEDREAAVLAAARERPAGQSLLEAFHAMCLDQVRFIPRMRTQRSRNFSALIAANPSLQRRAHEINARLTAVLAEALTDQTGLPAGDPLLDIVAGTMINTQRSLYRSLHNRVLRDSTDAVIAREHRRDVDRVFHQLRAGLTNLPRP